MPQSYHPVFLAQHKCHHSTDVALCHDQTLWGENKDIRKVDICSSEKLCRIRHQTKTYLKAKTNSPTLFWYKTGDFPNDDDWQV